MNSRIKTIKQIQIKMIIRISNLMITKRKINKMMIQIKTIQILPMIHKTMIKSQIIKTISKINLIINKINHRLLIQSQVFKLKKMNKLARQTQFRKLNLNKMMGKIS